MEKLLDKYEDRKEGSHKRVQIICSKKEVPIPELESGAYVAFLEEMEKLKEAQLIDFDWIRKGYVIDRIWLDLSHVNEAYRFIDRETRAQQVQHAVQQIDSVLPRLHADWIFQGLEADKSQLLEKNRLYGIWKQTSIYRQEFLEALCCVDSLEGNSVTMRAFSIRLYSDSKHFERDIKKSFAAWIREHEPVLRETEELEERDILAYVGVLMMPEIFELCGNVRLHFADGKVDYAPMRKGGCILASCVKDIQRIELAGIRRILFIENRTNYAEYCIKEKTKEELVIYHGGFYSPQHGEFFRKLYAAAKDIPLYFWADIDYGGFQMYHRLKSNLIPVLLPFRMDVPAFHSHKQNGLKRSEAYLQKLSVLLSQSEFQVFHPVIEEILAEKMTVEQESFLL